MTVRIYGISDDLIEIEGAIDEEFTYDDNDGEGMLIAFSDGTVLRVIYSSSGVWRISPVQIGTTPLSIDQAPEDDEDNYSDGATLGGMIEWVMGGTQLATLAANPGKE